MATKYPGLEIIESSNYPSPSKNPKVRDVVQVYSYIPTFGQANHVYLDDVFDESNAYTATRRFTNHFQGVARHPCGDYFVISGGDKKVGYAHLFVVKMSSYLKYAGLDIHHKRGPIRSNLISSDGRDTLDKISELFVLDKTLYHAGGISFCGDVLVVPLENNKRSEIAFVDFRKPDKPKLLNVRISRDNLKAGCATMTILPNGHYLCAVWTEHKGRKLDLYLSNKKNLKDGFHDVITVPYSTFVDVPKEKPRYQGMSWVEDVNGDLFIIGWDDLTNGGKMNNRIFLMRIDLPDDMIKNNPKLVAPIVCMYRSRAMHHGYTYYNFNSAGGLYIDPNGAISLYSTGTSRGGQKKATRINLCEFYQRDPTAKCKKKEYGYIELFTEPNFLGRSLVIQPYRESKISDLSKVKVPGPHIEDKVASVIYCLPKGTNYTLFEDDNFNNDHSGQVNERKNSLTLTGEGKVVWITDLNNRRLRGLKFPKPFGRFISSAKHV